MTKEELEKKVAELEAEKAELIQKQAVPQKNVEKPIAMRLELPNQDATPTIHFESKEKTRIKLFKDNGNYKDPLYVCINGRTIMIQRGVTVEIDKYVADFIENQLADEALIWQRVEQEEKEYEELTDKMNR